MPADLHILGIRHHGPGSAHRLERALDAIAPARVLIEGPADASDLLPLLASEGMVPPVALLCYPADEPSEAAFWPFARFSPEYRAALWASANGAAMEFIDLPATARWEDEETEAADAAEEGSAEEAAGVTAGTEGVDDVESAGPAPVPSDPVAEPPVMRDPIGALARAAGYEDGEGWWNDVLERAGDDGDPTAAFTAVADAMAALRESAQGETQREGSPAHAFLRRLHERREERREAHMRLAIDAARKEAEGPVAVVCGAWHAPALGARVALKDDRATLKGMKKRKLAATWAPWTAPRLASGSGYGAGVTAPGWYGHLWDARESAHPTSLWLGRVARALRAKGYEASTASVIEAERLGTALAALREKPGPGFEELREAVVATLCAGEPARWLRLETDLLIGSEVGEIPEDVPLAPLLEDLKRQQKKVRLKPEALPRELALDLRSESGLARSTLLHRLAALDVPWGREEHAGGSRGTFRERWTVGWEPEYAVRLVEKLVYGSTIERAADARLAEEAGEATTLSAAASVVRRAITADLSGAVAAGLRALDERAAHATDCLDTLHALPPLAEVVRYGEARRTDAAETLPDLLEALIARAGIALPLASRDLDRQAATEFAAAMRGADAAVRLVAQGSAETWREGLAGVLDDPNAAPRVAGRAARLLYEADDLGSDEMARELRVRLSPGTPAAEAAEFFEGFFEGAGSRLIHDEALRGAVDAWLTSLDEDAFVEGLPLLRRVFADLDRSERKRLLDAALGKGRAAESGFAVPEAAMNVWAEREAALLALLTEGMMPPAVENGKGTSP